MPRILIVCTGNLCRSPLAEALLRQQLTTEGLDAEVASAGLEAPLAVQPDRRLRRVAAEVGVDLDDHSSTAVTRDELRSADLVLTMTADQSAAVRALVPSVAGRTITLRTAAWRARVIGGRRTTFAEWVRRLTSDGPEADSGRPDPAHDIADPIGGPLRDYRAMAGEVQSVVRALVDRWSGR